MKNDIWQFSSAIQLALAPAFLLSGIAALLNVMTGRLARIIDRGAVLGQAQAAALGDEATGIRLQRQSLERRRHLASVAITFSTIAALLVSLVIGGLFIEVMLQSALRWVISTLFAAAMSALVVGLVFFLREVHLAMRTVRIVAVHVGPASAAAAQARSRPDA